MDRTVLNILRRQLPIVAASFLTGAIMIGFLGFWLGIFVNTIAWGTGVFVAKMYIARTSRTIDPFQDDRFLMHFVLALIGRNK